MITDIKGKVLKSFKIDGTRFLATTINRIYFTVTKDRSVHCISMTGEVIWVHKDELFRSPNGIAVDGHQNVFVADTVSNSLIVIRHDGKTNRGLLSSYNGLFTPFVLHYNKKEKKTLLVFSTCGDTDVYNLE